MRPLLQQVLGLPKDWEQFVSQIFREVVETAPAPYTGRSRGPWIVSTGQPVATGAGLSLLDTPVVVSPGFYDILANTTVFTALAAARAVQLRKTGAAGGTQNMGEAAMATTIGDRWNISYPHVWLETNDFVSLVAITGFAVGETMRVSIILRPLYL